MRRPPDSEDVVRSLPQALATARGERREGRAPSGRGPGSTATAPASRPSRPPATTRACRAEPATTACWSPAGCCCWTRAWRPIPSARPISPHTSAVGPRPSSPPPAPRATRGRCFSPSLARRPSDGPPPSRFKPGETASGGREAPQGGAHRAAPRPLPAHRAGPVAGGPSGRGPRLGRGTHGGDRPRQRAQPGALHEDRRGLRVRACAPRCPSPAGSRATVSHLAGRYLFRLLG